MAITQFKKPDLIIWDWDGTLVDSWPVIFAAHNHVRTSLGFEVWSKEEFKEISYYSTDDIYPKLYGDRANEGIRILYDFLENIDPNETPFIQGADEVITLLSEAQIPMIVISNKQHDLLSKEISVASFGYHFFSFVGAGKLEKDKPNPLPVLHALSESNVDVRCALFVGDTQTDVDCAKNLPFETRSIIIGSNDTNGEDYRYKSLKEFGETLKKGFK